MKRPAIAKFVRRPNLISSNRQNERGVTMVLVAGAMVAILAMAALSIDVITLYLANAEAQRSADTAALAAARILSLDGVTGDPQNSAGDWAAACAQASQVAQNIANQNVVGGSVPSSVTVNYPQGCGGAGGVFGVNPVVQVQVQRGGLPTFFARIWGRRASTITATSTAEAFNPSGSAAYPAGEVYVQPRCVKPWMVANGTPAGYVDRAAGTITNPGIQLSYTGTGVIGSQVTLLAPGPPNCTGASCILLEGKSLTNNQYIAAAVQGTPVAVASGATGDPWQEAIAGCDQTTVYACGSPGGAMADLTVNLGAADTYTASEALINGVTGGQDSIVTTTYPFQIRAGFNNPLVSKAIVFDDEVITSSNSVVTVPLIDNTLPLPLASPQPNVTVVGFLQLFIQQVDNTTGNITGTVLNVSGCGNAGSPNSVTGTSPVPVRLINYP